MSENKFYSFIPFFIFVAIFLGAGILLDDFYKFPTPVAMCFGIIAAFIMYYKTSTENKIVALMQGCGDSRIITMCIIYLLAGAFAAVTSAIGGVDMMVNIGLSFIPVEYLALGIFVIACFLSLSIGTSVGSVVALGPIVVALAQKTDISMGLLCGSLLGGSMFGDNLSIISDTTITATQTIGCNMKDKFKANLKYALPAALITLVILFFLGDSSKEIILDLDPVHNYWVILPYIAIIVLALLGVQVFIALVLGILMAGIIGLVQLNFDFIGLVNHIYQGFTSMTEIFLLSMLTGGLAALVEQQGGIKWLLALMHKKIKSARSAEYGIALLVASINLCMANNTVAILTAGGLSRDITDTYKLNRPDVASILDIFACVIQGIIPYGAQVLILLSFSQGQLDYLELLSNTYYVGILFVITSLYMLFIKKYPQTK
ncbi:Na+/H+ antiporter NhaC family protein [Myroides sp. LJL116]